MRGHAVFGMFVHRLRANLHLDRAAIHITHHRVQRLVTIGFGLGNVVVEFLLDGCKVFVHPTQHLVAIGHALHHHAQGTNIEYTVKSERLAAHFSHDAVDVFGPPLDRSRNALLGKRLLQTLAQFQHVPFAFSAFFIEQPCNVFVGCRLQKTK